MTRSCCKSWASQVPTLPRNRPWKIGGSRLCLNCMHLTTMVPPELYAAWKAEFATMPTLAPHAMRQFLRPISSSACERIFSYLTHMDRADRSGTKKETLHLLILLRGNSEILDKLVQEAYAARLNADTGNKSKRARNNPPAP